jgi:ATP-dependent RNA helicase SUPV3L1/SUV3
MLAPRVEVLPSDLLEGPHRELIRRRLAAWLDAHLATMLAPLLRLRAAELAGPARGLAFELVAASGCVMRRRVAALVAALDREARDVLAGHGVVIGEHAVFLPALRSHRSLGLRAVLWRVFAGRPGDAPLPAPALSHPRGPSEDSGLMAALFLLPAGPRHVRADRLERLGREAYRRGRGGAFAVDPAWSTLIGAPETDVEGVLRALGLRLRVDGDVRLLALPPRERRRHQAELRRDAVDESSPFAGLAHLVRR